MADGIKIRELKLTNAVANDDVFVIDKLSNITQENVTFQLTFKDFKDNYLGDALVDQPTDGQVLVWESGRWTNKDSASGVSGTDLGGALLFPSSLDPIVLKVTVGDRTDGNRFINDTTSDKAFFIDEQEAPALVFGPARPYRFDVSHPTCDGYSFRLFTIPTNSGFLSPYTYNVTTVGNGGEVGAYVEVVFTQRYEMSFGSSALVEESPRALFYNCIKADGHDFMGNSIFNVGRIQDVEFSIGDDGGNGGGGGLFPLLGPSDIMEKVTTLETQVADLTAHVESLITIE